MRVEASDVQRWFCEAWPKQNQHPDMRWCYTVAIRINVIVDRQNASAGRSASEKVIKDRRQVRLSASRQARALQKTLAIMARDLEDELSLTSIEGLSVPNDKLMRHISVTQQAQAAIESFLKLPKPPKYEDHADPILWISAAVEESWRNILPDASIGQKKKMFSKSSESPLVKFIDRALEAIGLPIAGKWENRCETISNHLRQRHNRPRGARGASKKVEAN
jgi:hypothetical protein